MYHPTPDTGLIRTDAVRYTIRHDQPYVRLNDPRIDEAHIHNSYELYLSISGDVDFLVDNRLYSVTSGDIIFTRPGEMHLFIYRSACRHEHFCLWFDLPQDCDWLYSLRGADIGNRFSPDPETRTQLSALFYQLAALQKPPIADEGSTEAEAMESPATMPIGPTLRQTTCFLQVLSALSAMTAIPEPSPALGMLPAKLQEILNYINEHFESIHCIKDLSEQFYFSPSTIHRWFRDYIICHPVSFWNPKS